MRKQIEFSKIESNRPDENHAKGKAASPLLTALLNLGLGLIPHGGGATLTLNGRFEPAAPKPNVVFILADDLGYGDLSIYGQEKLRTPNIDRIGNEGLLFTQHYAGNTVCSPSRASLMTGQHPGVVHCRTNTGERRLALDPEMVVLPDLFQRAGYATGAYGKWGLGQTTESDAQNPMVHGFDHFSGWKDQRIAHTYYPSSIVRDGVEQPLEEGTYIHDLIMADAFAFIRENATSGKPFFCYIPTAIPHAAMHAPPDLHEKWRRQLPHFDGKIGRYGAGPGETCPPVVNPVAGFAAMIEHLDNQVGQLLDLLEETGVADHTIIIFTSDNGPHSEGGNEPEFWKSSGPLRGIKRSLYEGGIRVPLLIRWPRVILPGSRSDHISAFWDFLPTFAALTGQPVPAQNTGISLWPTLSGDPENQSEHPYLYWETSDHRVGAKMAIRQGPWKGVLLTAESSSDKSREKISFELYNLRDDLSESNNLAEHYPEKAKELLKAMNQMRETPCPLFEERMKPLVDYISAVDKTL